MKGQFKLEVIFFVSIGFADLPTLWDLICHLCTAVAEECNRFLTSYKVRLKCVLLWANKQLYVKLHHLPYSWTYIIKVYRLLRDLWNFVCPMLWPADIINRAGFRALRNGSAWRSFHKWHEMLQMVRKGWASWGNLFIYYVLQLTHFGYLSMTFHYLLLHI